MNFPNKKYDIIYLDPPWKYSDKGCNGNAESQYKTMSLEDLRKLDIQSIASENCVMFIWITYPMLQEGLSCIKSWGFEFKSIGFQWIKLNRKNGKPFYGLGRWTRGNSEACFIAVKGKPSRVDKGVFQLVQSPIRRHSQKPDEVRDLIVKLMGDRPRIELFARNSTPGWDVWGNELTSALNDGSITK